MSFLISAEAERERRHQEKSNRRKSGPVYDPRTITEPVATVAQRMEIERLRKGLRDLSTRGNPNPYAGLVGKGGKLPKTHREAAHVIGNLWELIGKRLDQLPEDQRKQNRWHKRLIEHRERTARENQAA